ncbi:MAG: radical SAM protein [bacterium]
MKKNRLALIIPPVIMHGYRDAGCKQSLPHIGIGYLASNVNSERAEIKIYDCPVERMTIDKLITELRQFNPDIVGFTAMTHQIDEAATAAAAVKKAFAKTTTIIGGYHATPLPVETLERYPAFDIAVHGEGEITLQYLLDALSDSADLSSINGICYRRNDEIKLNPPRELIRNLDTLSFPAYHLMPMEKYRGYYTVFLFRNRGAMLATARGCPYQCVFCFKLSGSHYRPRSIDAVVEEIKRDINDFNINQFLITDEAFTLKRDRVRLFCEKLLQEGISKKIKWICESRVDHVDLEILKLMKKAGCQIIGFGIESGNQEILDKIKKNFKLETAVQAIRLTKQAAILTETNFILGHPFETRQTIKDTINFAVKLNAHLALFGILSPFPGTAVYEMAKKGTGGLKLLTDDYTKYGKHIGSSLELDNLSRKELEKYHRLAYMRFFLRPSKFLWLFLVIDIRMIFLMARNALVSLFKPTRSDPKNQKCRLN